MSGFHDHCCDHAPVFTGDNPAFRRALWAVILINAVMFVVEVIAGITADSMALQADALDFLGDTATYALSLFVLAKPPSWRANAALFKGLTLAILGLWVLGSTIWRVFVTGVPEAVIMGTIGLLALGANIASVLILLRFRDGDANVRSVWLCSRNDAIGNVAVVLAATGVFATGTAWPDLAVAAIMASLFLTSAVKITRQALGERQALVAAGE
jgi:Co/Zn/Cd efflux system component